ncbi:MAG: A/G-specific adenine glycosylase [Candidatus Sumerlaeaceae bacterium]
MLKVARTHTVNMKKAHTDRTRPGRSNGSEMDAAALSAAVIQWFRLHQRDLPFRHTTDPYAILVSELMLQQTQVATAVSYFERFMDQFPTVQALAEANEQQVLAMWAGLGYYRRARLLQSAARKIAEDYSGVFPTALVDIQALPGVGRYTAGAVYSFAYDRPAPIVEANTARLLARLFAIRGAIKSTANQAQLWKHAEQLLPAQNAREHNYGVMELGALVCKPVPLCDKCPLTRWCAAFQTGQSTTIPEIAAKPTKLRRHFVGIVACSGEHYLVRRIPEGEWHHGMFEFPSVRVEHGQTAAQHLNALESMTIGTCASLRDVDSFAEYRYTVTNHAVHLLVYKANALPAASWPESFQWKTLHEISRLPLGSTQRKLLDLLQSQDDLLAVIR